MKLWHADYAWTGRLAQDVLIETDGGRIVSVGESAEQIPADAEHLSGLVLPGLANVHSHAFHRALRGGGGSGSDFWEWRDHMYAVADSLDPDSYFELARAVYAEMVLAGVTAVGEFHYLHHQAGGKPYLDPNAMAASLIAAADEVGIRLTLLDTCYLRADFDQELAGAQLRFSDGNAEAWQDRVSQLQPSEMVRVGAAAHSVRALPVDALEAVSAWASEHEAPLHVHVSEQPAENERCLAALGLTPTQVLDAAGFWVTSGTAVHATLLTGTDVSLLGGNRATVCFCPTTERDLGDGIGPGRALAEAGARLCVGSDSQVVIDLLEEMRLIDLHERLAGGHRDAHSADQIIAFGTSNGMEALGWEAGILAEGRLADFVAIDLESVRTAGPTDQVTARVLSAATSSDVNTVVVGGERLVSGGRHVAIEDVPAALRAAISRLPG